jgi:hypothetical protein
VVCTACAAAPPRSLPCTAAPDQHTAHSTQHTASPPPPRESDSSVWGLDGLNREQLRPSRPPRRHGVRSGREGDREPAARPSPPWIRWKHRRSWRTRPARHTGAVSRVLRVRRGGGSSGAPSAASSPAPAMVGAAAAAPRAPARQRRLLTRRARIALGTATQCTRRNDSPPPPPRERRAPCSTPPAPGPS